MLYIYDVSGLSSGESGNFFSELHGTLVEKFGEPSETAEKWINDRYSDDPAMVRTAIENGEYKWISLWEKEDYWVVFDIGGNMVAYTNSGDEASIVKAQIERLK